MTGKVEPIVALVLKAIALAMAVAVIVLGILSAESSNGLISLLGIGLLALALAGFMQAKVD